MKRLYRKVHNLRSNRVSQLNKTLQDDAVSIKHSPLRRIRCSQEWTFGGASLFENHSSGFLLVFIHNIKKYFWAFAQMGKRSPGRNLDQQHREAVEGSKEKGRGWSGKLSTRSGLSLGRMSWRFWVWSMEIFVWILGSRASATYTFSFRHPETLY